MAEEEIKSEIFLTRPAEFPREDMEVILQRLGDSLVQLYKNNSGFSGRAIFHFKVVVGKESDFVEEVDYGC